MDVWKAALGTAEGFLMTRRGWAKRLLQDKVFAESYVRRYQDLRNSTLSTLSLLDSIDTMSSSLDKASATFAAGPFWAFTYGLTVL